MPAGSPVRFICLCLSVMRSHLLYSIFGLAWLIVDSGTLVLSVVLIVLVGTIWIRLLKHIVDGKSTYPFVYLCKVIGSKAWV